MATPQHLTREQSIAKYGSEKYTAWDTVGAEADWKASGAIAPPNLNTTEDVTSFLNQQQQTNYANINVPTLELPDFKIPTAEELKAEVMPGTPAPTPINRTGLLEQQREKYGVMELEDELNKLKADERAIKTQLKDLTGQEEGKSVALNVISGRITEEERQASIRLSYLADQKLAVTDELNIKYNAINTFINYAGLDYQDALQAYEAEFGRNLQIQQMLSGFRQESWGYKKDVYDSQVKGIELKMEGARLDETIRQNKIDNARANLTTITNAITSGNMTYDNLPADQKIQIQKLEMQSGLPVGTISNMQLAAKDKILGFSDDKTQAMVLDGSGNMKVISTGFTKSATKQTEAQKKQESLSLVIEYLDLVKNDYGHVSYQDYNKIRSEAVKSGGLTDDEFVKNTIRYTDPNRDTYEADYGIKKSERTYMSSADDFLKGIIGQ